MVSDMDLFKAVVFILHFSFFGVTTVFFLFKFHKKDKLKPVMLATAIPWIIFGSIDFFLGLKAVLVILA